MNKIEQKAVDLALDIIQRRLEAVRDGQAEQLAFVEAQLEAVRRRRDGASSLDVAPEQFRDAAAHVDFQVNEITQKFAGIERTTAVQATPTPRRAAK